MKTKYNTLQISTIAERKSFAIHLVDRFGSTATASQCIEEMLKVCPEGSDYHALIEIRHKINDHSYLNYSGFNTKTK